MSDNSAAAMLRSESLMDLLASDDDDDLDFDDDDDDIDAFISKMGVTKKEEPKKEEEKKETPPPAAEEKEKKEPEPSAPAANPAASTAESEAEARINAELAKRAAEAKAKDDPGATAAAAKAKEEEEAKNAKLKEEAERKAKEDAERKAKEDAEKKLKDEAERKAKEEADKKAKAEAERTAKADAEQRLKEEMEAKVRAEMEAKAKAEAEKKEKEEMEARIRAEAEAKVRAEMEGAKAKAEAEEKKKKEKEEAEKAEKAKQRKAKSSAASKSMSPNNSIAQSKARPSSAHTSRRASNDIKRGGSRPQSAGSRASSSRPRVGSVASSTQSRGTAATATRPKANGRVDNNDGIDEQAEDDAHEDFKPSESLTARRQGPDLSIATQDLRQDGSSDEPHSPGGGRLTPRALRQFLAEATPTEKPRSRPVVSSRIITKAATDHRRPASMTRKAKEERARVARNSNDAHPQYKTFMFPDRMQKSGRYSDGGASSPLLDLLQREESLRARAGDSPQEHGSPIPVYVSQSPAAVMLSPRRSASQSPRQQPRPPHARHHSRLAKKRASAPIIDSLAKGAHRRRSSEGGRSSPSRRSPRARKVQSQAAYVSSPLAYEDEVAVAEPAPFDENQMTKFHNTLKYLMRLWEQLAFPEDDRLEFIALYGEANRMNAENLLEQVSRMQDLRKFVRAILEIVEEREALLSRLRNLHNKPKQSEQFTGVVERFLQRTEDVEVAIGSLKVEAPWINVFMWRNQDYSAKMVQDAAEIRQMQQTV